MSLVGQWRELEATLPEGWDTAQLRLEVGDAGRAAALLGPAQPYRTEPSVLRFDSARDGNAPSPDSLARMLARLDREKITGQLSLIGSREDAATPERVFTSLVASWDAELAKLPADWSDLHAEIELLSTDYVERASVLCVPLNPRREGTRAALRFRAASRFGYGAAKPMVRRCLERCDAEGIRGSVTVLRAFSDTHPVGTQGPVWMISGKTV